MIDGDAEVRGRRNEDRRRTSDHSDTRETLTSSRRDRSKNHIQQSTSIIRVLYSIQYAKGHAQTELRPLPSYTHPNGKGDNQCLCQALYSLVHLLYFLIYCPVVRMKETNDVFDSPVKTKQVRLDREISHVPEPHSRNPYLSLIRALHRCRLWTAEACRV